MILWDSDVDGHSRSVRYRAHTLGISGFPARPIECRFEAYVQGIGTRQFATFDTAYRWCQRRDA